MLVKSICVVTEGYPYKADPQFSFVEVLCRAFARKGIRIFVISPQSILHVALGKEKKHPLSRTYSEKDGAEITVYRPWFLLLPYKFRKYNEQAFKTAVQNTFYKKNISPTICYGHFWNNGYYISDVCIKNNIPLFIASGEGNFDDLKLLYTSDVYRKFANNVSGVICVSSSCRDNSISLGLAAPEKCIVIPNAIDHNLFYKKEKTSLRQSYGIPLNKFIVIYIGSFIHRKGSDRLSAALEQINDAEICSFFIGAGQGPENLQPSCKGVLYCGKIIHDKLVDYLCMADIFVLPTLNEGCCNAIIEAMACGLPIISSDKPFNYDLLDNTNSILVDPLNIEEIANAILCLKDNQGLRMKLGLGALKTAQKQEINIRAEKILEYIESKL